MSESIEKYLAANTAEAAQYPILTTPDWLLEYQASGHSFPVEKGSLRAHPFDLDAIEFNRISNVAVGDYSVQKLEGEYQTIHYRDEKGEVRVNRIPTSRVTIIAGQGRRRYSTFHYAFLNSRGNTSIIQER